MTSPLAYAGFSPDFYCVRTVHTVKVLVSVFRRGAIRGRWKSRNVDSECSPWIPNAWIKASLRPSEATVKGKDRVEESLQKSCLSDRWGGAVRHGELM